MAASGLIWGASKANEMLGDKFGKAIEQVNDEGDNIVAKGYFHDATIQNIGFTIGTSGLFAGIDWLGDQDVKTISKGIALRVPVMMALQKLMSTNVVHTALRNAPVLGGTVAPCSTAEIHDDGYCAMRAATLATLLYVYAIDPALNRGVSSIGDIFNYGREKAFELKNWAFSRPE